jgi:8-oxo-dGTP pyrophosphatase MutT (NUDIX family)
MFWEPPGGGLEVGETFEQAALPEASEELGMTSLSLAFMWEQMADFVYIDHPVLQQERFFRVKGDLADLLANVQEIHRRESILETRWWTLADLESTKEAVFPSELAGKVRRFLN